MSDPAQQMLDFISASPTPFHCVAEARRRLDEAGYAGLDERSEWDLDDDAGYFVERGGGSIIAFRTGGRSPAEAGFRVVGAHTDSPNLRLKPRPGRKSDGWLRADVEVYGGPILPTWVDRDLGLAGRLVVRRTNGNLEQVLVDIDRPIARIPTLAIHLSRKVNEEGLKLDNHRDLGPALALLGGGDSDVAPSAAILSAVAEAAHVDVDAIRGHDLCFYDLAPPTIGGLREELVFSARLDNQAMCHAAMAGLLASPAELLPPSQTAVVALFDHEEVGSNSARGAAGPFLKDVLTRIAGGVTEMSRAMPSSLLVSADMAHAVHPSRADRHDGEHLPRINGGPVVKTHVGQRYATDAYTGAAFRSLCAAVDSPVQEFVVRQDIPCGSTIGPITAAELGMPTVDVGNPMLSMHSVREMAGAHDPAHMNRVLAAFLGGAPL
jgi:aspartyl aminopeptidase